MSSRPFDSFPTGTEPYDRLGDRLRIVLEPVPDEIAKSDEPVRITYQILFDGQPLNALDHWPTEDDCEDIQYHLIPKGSAVSETGYSGPQPQDHYNVARIGNTRDGTTFGESFSGENLKPGRYRYTLVVVAHLDLPSGSTIAARRLDFEIRVSAATADRTLFWAVEHVSQAFARINRQRFHMFVDGRHTGSVDGPNCQSLLRAPNNLLIGSRHFTVDPGTGDAFIFHYATGTGPAQIRQITTDGQFITLPSVAGLDLTRPQCLMADSANDRLWVATGHDLHLVRLSDMTLLETRNGLPVSSMELDRATGQLWVGAARAPGGGQAHLQRIAPDLSTDISVPQVTVDGTGQVKSIQSMRDGSVVVNGSLQSRSGYIRLDGFGNVAAQSPHRQHPVGQFGVNLTNGEIWELMLEHGRIPLIRRLSADFDEMSRHGRVELGFINIFGCDYVPSQAGAVVYGMRRFDLPPINRGQLVVLKDDGSTGAIQFTGNVMGIVHSAF